MCMLSFIPTAARLDNFVIDELYNGGLCNPDGYGWAVVTGDTVLIGKSLDLDAALCDFIDARDMYGGDAMFHSRYATHGSIRLETCHPFIVGGDNRTVLGHNGVLPGRYHPTDSDGDISDTMVLASRGMRRYRRLDRPTVISALSRDIGTNKLVILTVNPRYRHNAYVINEHLGEWSEDVWHSNADYRFGRYRRSVAATYPPVIGAVAATATTDGDDGGDDCPFCGQLVSGGYCTLCSTCIDCLEPEQSCQCWGGYALDSAERYCPF